MAPSYILNQLWLIAKCILGNRHQISIAKLLLKMFSSKGRFDRVPLSKAVTAVASCKKNLRYVIASKMSRDIANGLWQLSVSNFARKKMWHDIGFLYEKGYWRQEISIIAKEQIKQIHENMFSSEDFCDVGYLSQSDHKLKIAFRFVSFLIFA